MLRPLPRHAFFLQWLVFLLVVLFALYLTADLGLLQYLVAGDVTRLSGLILLLMLVGLGHGALRAHDISRELDSLYALGTGGASDDGSLTGDYIRLRLAHLDEGPGADEADSTLLSVFSERMLGQQDFGWFLVNFVVKLGLLGTVIGFILMLRSVVGIDTADVSDIQVLLVEMTGGMSVALHTTLTGLVASAVLSVQYLWCDHGATRLVADVAFFTERQRVEAAR